VKIKNVQQRISKTAIEAHHAAILLCFGSKASKAFRTLDLNPGPKPVEA
jgi:hypothetical protein